MNNPTTFKQSFIEDCPESEILLCAGRTRMDAKNAARIEALLESNLNWKRVLQLAEQHGLMPLLYKHLGFARNVRFARKVGGLPDKSMVFSGRFLFLVLEFVMPLPSRNEQTNTIAVNRKFAETNKKIEALERTLNALLRDINEIKATLVQLAKNQNQPVEKK